MLAGSPLPLPLLVQRGWTPAWRDDPPLYSYPVYLTTLKKDRSCNSFVVCIDCKDIVFTLIGTNQNRILSAFNELMYNKEQLNVFFQVQLTQNSATPPKRPRSSSKCHTVTMAPISHTPSPPLSNQLFFNSVEEVIRARIRCPSEIAQVIRNNPQLGFLYMTPAAPKSSIKYDPYKLK